LTAEDHQKLNLNEGMIEKSAKSQVRTMKNEFMGEILSESFLSSTGQKKAKLMLRSSLHSSKNLIKSFKGSHNYEKGPKT
jgi:hypothetical protein